MHVVTKLGHSVPFVRNSLNFQDVHSLCQPERSWKCQSGYKDRMRVSVVRYMTSLIQLQQHCTVLGRTEESYFLPFPQPLNIWNWILNYKVWILWKVNSFWPQETSELSSLLLRSRKIYKCQGLTETYISSPTLLFGDEKLSPRGKVTHLRSQVST